MTSMNATLPPMAQMPFSLGPCGAHPSSHRFRALSGPSLGGFPLPSAQYLYCSARERQSNMISSLMTSPSLDRQTHLEIKIGLLQLSEHLCILEDVVVDSNPRVPLPTGFQKTKKWGSSKRLLTPLKRSEMMRLSRAGKGKPPHWIRSWPSWEYEREPVARLEGRTRM